MKRAKQERRIIKILQNPHPPQSYDSEALFERLQKSYNPPLEYGYDSYSTWKRELERASRLLQFVELRTPRMRVLEAGCCDARTGYALACYGHRITLVDLEDWRDERAHNIFC